MKMGLKILILFTFLFIISCSKDEGGTVVNIPVIKKVVSIDGSNAKAFFMSFHLEPTEKYPNIINYTEEKEDMSYYKLYKITRDNSIEEVLFTDGDNNKLISNLHLKDVKDLKNYLYISMVNEQLEPLEYIYLKGSSKLIPIPSTEYYLENFTYANNPNIISDSSGNLYMIRKKGNYKDQTGELYLVKISVDYSNNDVAIIPISKEGELTDGYINFSIRGNRVAYEIQNSNSYNKEIELFSFPSNYMNLGEGKLIEKQCYFSYQYNEYDPFRIELYKENLDSEYVSIYDFENFGTQNLIPDDIIQNNPDSYFGFLSEFYISSGVRIIQYYMSGTTHTIEYDSSTNKWTELTILSDVNLSMDYQETNKYIYFLVSTSSGSNILKFNKDTKEYKYLFKEDTVDINRFIVRDNDEVIFEGKDRLSEKYMKGIINLLEEKTILYEQEGYIN